MVFYFKARSKSDDYSIFMGLDKYENKEFIKYDFPEDICVMITVYVGHFNRRCAVFLDHNYTRQPVINISMIAWKRTTPLVQQRPNAEWHGAAVHSITWQWKRRFYYIENNYKKKTQGCFPRWVMDAIARGDSDFNDRKNNYPDFVVH